MFLPFVVNKGEYINGNNYNIIIIYQFCYILILMFLLRVGEKARKISRISRNMCIQLRLRYALYFEKLRRDIIINFIHREISIA